MKKVKLAWLALPLVVAACSSEEEIAVSGQANNQMYANIPQVEVGFDWGTDTKMATEWGLEDDDVVGLAWMGVPQGTSAGQALPEYGGASLAITGNAYQNHPLYAKSNNTLQPETSIYVGKYFSYLPYDYETKNIGKIGFSVENQPLIDGNKDNQTWNKTAAHSIWISPQWTDVTLAGDKYENNAAGVGKTFDIYPRKLSNGVALNFDYTENHPTTCIAPEIYEIQIGYEKSSAAQAVVAFDYAPIVEDGVVVKGGNENYWADKDFATMESTGIAENDRNVGYVTLTAEGSIETTNNNDHGSFAYNALPAAEALEGTDNVIIKISNTYGELTISKPVNKIAYTFGDNGYENDPDGTTIPAGTSVSMNESFVNKFYKNGKFETEVDFSQSVMDNMHIRDNEHLLNVLKYYKEKKLDNPSAAISEAKSGVDITLNLDGNKSDNEFIMNLEAVKLLQEINADKTIGDKRIGLVACNTHQGGGKAKIVLVSEENGSVLPDMQKMFNFQSKTEVILRGSWTWNKVIATNNIAKFINEGTISIAGTEVGTKWDENINDQTDVDNALNGVINVNTVTNWKTANLSNLGRIYINPGNELRVNAADLTNNATDNAVDNYDNVGRIYNYGVLGTVDGTNAYIYNYGGYIKNNEGAKTYITRNEVNNASFSYGFASSGNYLGTIELSTATDNVSVSNATDKGFIKYTWDGTEDGKYVTPSDDVKYNYLIVTKNIEFTETEPEILYIEVAGPSEVVITNKTAADGGFAAANNRLQGFIMKAGTKANIKEGNRICSMAAYLKGTLYLGGEFYYNGDLQTYFGGELSDKNNIIRQ